MAFARGTVGVGEEEDNIVCGGGEIDQTSSDAIKHLQVGRIAVVDFVDLVKSLWVRRNRRRADQKASRGHCGVSWHCTLMEGQVGVAKSERKGRVTTRRAERLREERSVVIERRARETFLKTVCGLGGGESAADEIREKSAAIGHTTKG